jgi:hypothetical protein
MRDYLAQGGRTMDTERVFDAPISARGMRSQAPIDGFDRDRPMIRQGAGAADSGGQVSG